MLKIIILTESTKYTYHTIAGQYIQSHLNAIGHTTTTFDIDVHQQRSEYIRKINNLRPDILITLDLVGFHFRTQASEIALNMLPTKNLNLIWGNKQEYAPLLRKKLSLSMLFYDVSGTDHHLPELYPNMLYYHVAESIDAFPQIWADFTKEVLLS